ncbi:MAG: helix-turn-helix domain-containing protein [Ruminococcus sp.]|nr:helix-turn-helix domain-containing protein [Ruminococcus sp.]
MDFEKVQELHEAGFTQKEIARRTGYSQSSISIALRAMNYRYNGRAGIKDLSQIKNPIIREFCRYNGLNVREFAGIIGCSVDKAKAFLEGSRDVRLSVRQLQRILSVMGMTFEEVFCGGCE